VPAPQIRSRDVWRYINLYACMCRHFRCRSTVSLASPIQQSPNISLCSASRVHTCSNRSISPASRAHSSKPSCSSEFAAVCPCWDRQTHGHRTVTQTFLRMQAVPINGRNSKRSTIIIFGADVWSLASLVQQSPKFNNRHKSVVC